MCGVGPGRGPRLHSWSRSHRSQRTRSRMRRVRCRPTSQRRERDVNRIEVLIVDDHPLFRRGIRWSLEEWREIRVVREVPDAQEAIRVAGMLSPTVVLLDLDLPGMSGLELCRVLKRRPPQAAIVVLWMHEDDEQLFSSTRVGASAYCTKD